MALTDPAAALEGELLTAMMQAAWLEDAFAATNNPVARTLWLVAHAHCAQVAQACILIGVEQQRVEAGERLARQMVDTLQALARTLGGA